MDKLEELGKLWQNYQPEKIENKEIDLKETGIFKRLKNLEKKQFRINLAKTIIVSISLITMAYALLGLSVVSFWTISALAWIFGTLLIGMIIYWKKQYNSSSLAFCENSTVFFKKTILKLEEQKQIITHLVPMIIICVILGMNAIYYDLLKDEELSFRITSHLSITFLFLLIAYLGIKVRKRRYKNDFKPMIDELRSIKQNFKEDIHE